MNRNAFGYYPLQLGDEHFLLDMERNTGGLMAWLYPVDDERTAHPGEQNIDRDRYALDLAALGDDDDDDWYDLTNDEIAANIAEALDQTEVEASLEDDLQSAIDGETGIAAGLHEWAVAGHKLAMAIMPPVAYSAVPNQAIDAIAAALAEYRKTTGADLSGTRRPIPWAFGGPGEKEAA